MTTREFDNDVDDDGRPNGGGGGVGMPKQEHNHATTRITTSFRGTWEESWKMERLVSLFYRGGRVPVSVMVVAPTMMSLYCFVLI